MLSTAELSTSWQINSERTRLILLAVLALLLSLLASRAILLFELGAVVIVFSVLTVAAVVWQPTVGLYLAFALVLLFEPGGPDLLMLPGRYLNWGLQSTLGLSGLIASPIELLLLLTLLSWLGRGIMSRRLEIRGGRLRRPVLCFFALVIFGLLRGTLADGDTYIAFWEARALFYVFTCYLLASNLIRNRRQLDTLMAIMLVSTGVFAVEGAYRHIALIQTGELGAPPEFAYSHDTVIYLGTVLLLILAQSVVGAPLWHRLFGPLIVPITIFTLLATQRRAGYIALMVAFLAFSVIFAVKHRRAFMFMVVPVLIGSAFYLPIFWNNTGLLGQPARAVRSLSEPDARDASSNDYRRLEKINVIETIKSSPLTGVGFGREFLFAIPMPSLSWWPFWRYEPHHNLLWVWLKTGALGFVMFWFLMGTAIALATNLARTLPDRESRTFALFALAGLTTTLVFCYVDLGLVNSRVTVFLGTLLGTLAVLDQVHA
jgi:O-antigen ligase